ncbi:hypothetical protein A3B60_00070 [Candidatus Peregrinibacteria bacterium RIFCSPLOWO2_01_FULL_39_12]|nr:MAG: hypothetical protein A3B60_00070 [Candidatus Peregrinibacteria bacterium RIFCSPLOWO2_01_FULL_39_12]OGJ43343.1 MAG: hypothetical protein A3I58_03785 [Candidatus Peregrinibacteria bacterium RIFCSPLOWO2_02_FULL_39_10]
MKLRDFSHRWVDECTGTDAVPIFTGDIRDLPDVLGVPSSCLTIRHVEKSMAKARGGDIWDYRCNDLLGVADDVDALRYETRRYIDEFGPDGAVIADCGQVVEPIPRVQHTIEDEENGGYEDGMGED